MKKRAMEMGMTTIMAPKTRLLRKLPREGVMAVRPLLTQAILGSARSLPTISSCSLRAL
jgi:hypothetical protein